MSTHYCRHIKTNGRRCCSLAMRGQSFCFFHRALNAHHRSLNPVPDNTPTIIHPTNPDADGLQRNPVAAEYPPQPAPLILNFPPLEDRQAIQVAISMVATALAQNQIDSRRAASLVYALQLASSNAQHLETIPEFPTYESEVAADGTEIALDVDPREVLESEEEFADYEEEVESRSES